MLNSLGDLYFDRTVKKLLYGKTEHSKEVNTETFKVIQNYFAETGWF